MPSFFKMIPKTVGEHHLVRYRCDVWDNTLTPYVLDGQTFSAVRCHELGLLPQWVEVVCQHHLSGEDAPTGPSGSQVVCEETLVVRSHDEFLEDPSPIAAAGRSWFDTTDWPMILNEAASILNKARAEGRWRRNLEVSIAAAQVDEVLVTMRQQGRTLHHNVPFTALRYWWDAEAATFMEHSRFEHPYSDKDQESIEPIPTERMREILEGISHKTLKRSLYP